MSKINGIDVSECDYFEKQHIEDMYESDDCNVCIDNFCALCWKECEKHNGCYFKQLKRLQEENDKIKKQYNCYACGNCNGTEDYINLEKHHKGLRKQFDKFVKRNYTLSLRIEELEKENEELKETINRLQKDCKRNNDLYMKEWDKNYKLSEISKEYNARRCIEKLYRLICDDTKSAQETYITLKNEVSEFLRIHKTMSSKYEEAKQTYKQALEEIRSYCDEQNLKVDYTACYITNRIDEVLND